MKKSWISLVILIMCASPLLAVDFSSAGGHDESYQAGQQLAQAVDTTQDKFDQAQDAMKEMASNTQNNTSVAVETIKDKSKVAQNVMDNKAVQVKNETSNAIDNFKQGYYDESNQ